MTWLAPREARAAYSVGWFRLATLGLVVVLVLLAYPGRVTIDTLAWLLQARSGDFVDFQPPGAPLLIGLTETVWPGPFGFVTINLVVIVVGLMLFWRGHLRSAGGAFAASTVILFYPAVLSILPIAWRDITGLAITIVSLSIAAGLWRLEEQNSNARLRMALWVALLACGIVGTIFRENHAAGALPIVALPLVPVTRRLITSHWTSVLFATAAAFVILTLTSLLAFQFSNAVTRPVYVMQAWMTYRLAQMSVQLQENLLPSSLYPKVDVAALDNALQSSRSPYRHFFWMAYARGNNDAFPVITRQEQYDVLSKSFAVAVRQHPLTFLEVSLRDAKRLMAWRPGPTGGYYVSEQPSGVFPVKLPAGSVLSLEINWPTSIPWFSGALLSSWSKINRWVLVRSPLPIMVLALVLTLVAAVLGLPSLSLMVVTSASAVLHFLGVVWIAAIFDFRFGHQSIVMALICIVLFCIDVLVRRRQPAPD